MAFCREVDHRTRLVLSQQAGDQCDIANVPLHQLVAQIPLQAHQRFGVARVGEFVEVDDGLVAGGQPIEDKVGANEAGAAGDENGHEDAVLVGATGRGTTDLRF